MTTPAIILGLLVGPLLVDAVLGRLTRRRIAPAEHLGCLGIALVFCFTGVGHFIKTEPMTEMLPAWVPQRAALVYFTGVVELAAAAAVLAPRLRAATGVALIVMLLLFLPVNIYAAVHRLGMGGHQWGPIYLLIRIPLQAVLIGWTWWFAVQGSTAAPVRFSLATTFRQRPEEIAEQILDLSQWTDFTGYGLVAGIERADFDVRTPEVVGTRIRVRDKDGSSHVEEIVHWQPQRRVQLHMHEFSPPLSRLADSFEETWEFNRTGDHTHAVRTFELRPTSAVTRPALWLISILLKKAVQRHMNRLAGQAS